jgi:predicted unusual protein kinase regulating ubiquinone biosynthesis (AarF/ABC1/UbiB family)
MTLVRHPRRVWQVVKVFVRYWLAPRFGMGPRNESNERATGPQRMRLAIEELGGAWVKLGQMLAMRFDLLPAAYGDEMFKLLNQVRPFPYSQVREIVERELGRPPEEAFRSFETESFAAASIGQVHRAVLHSGEAVAVKVQRPGIRESIQADIRLMYAFSGLIDRMHLFGGTHTRSVIDEFARWTADELDYMVEARHAVRLWRNARSSRIQKVARVYREYTTSRVLTTELIDGIPVIDISRARREGNGAYLQSLADRGYDVDRVVRHLDWNMLNEVYVFGYFHADLHPANLFVLPGNVIGYVDFGIVGQLPEDVRESLVRYGQLLFRGDIESAVAELMRWLSPTRATDAAAARRRLARSHEEFYDELKAHVDSRQSTRSTDNPYSKLAVEIMKTVRSTQLTLSPSIVPYLKMLVTLGTLRHELATSYDLAAQVRRFFRLLVRQEAIQLLNPRFAMERAYAGVVRARRAMAFVEFLEDQQPSIAAATGSLLGFRTRAGNAGRRLVGLGLSALVVGALLYVVLAYPTGTEAMLPAGIPYEGVHYGLVVLLVAIVAVLIAHVRGMSSAD